MSYLVLMLVFEGVSGETLKNKNKVHGQFLACDIHKSRNSCKQVDLPFRTVWSDILSIAAIKLQVQ